MILLIDELKNLHYEFAEKSRNKSSTFEEKDLIIRKTMKFIYDNERLYDLYFQYINSAKKGLFDIDEFWSVGYFETDLPRLIKFIEDKTRTY